MGLKLQYFIGIFCLIQAIVQILVCALGIVQYFCLMDFLREAPNLVFIRILYFNNPERCGNTINIGQVISGVQNHAYVLFLTEPFTTKRTYIINIVSLGLGIIWMTTTIILLAGTKRTHYSRRIRWPFVTLTICMCVFDIIASTIYANDAFHTRTLGDILNYVGGKVIGVAGNTIDTVAASWLMFGLFFRFGVVLLNMLFALVIGMGSNIGVMLNAVATARSSENIIKPPLAFTSQTRTLDDSLNDENMMSIAMASDMFDETGSPRIPRARYNTIFGDLKNVLTREPPTDVRERGVTFIETQDQGPSTARIFQKRNATPLHPKKRQRSRPDKNNYYVRFNAGIDDTATRAQLPWATYTDERRTTAPVKYQFSAYI
ncbi:uncharacterized protein LOC112047833 [Bicyclus anynana]|uniref:Uncharacterized protein LOC112047833 n=1 Tax=Bicyclus anynana TaxID=110368 RepID=A0A6J1NCS9_BICAN|nr:uncharacterized protein LOC112047833 [Bicyclus anynana]